MIKLIKLFLWIVATLIIAYFLADFKIGGKTIKQRVDHFLQGDIAGKAKNLFNDSKSSGLDSNIVSESHGPPQEEIKSSDQKKLKNILDKEK